MRQIAFGIVSIVVFLGCTGDQPGSQTELEQSAAAVTRAKDPGALVAVTMASTVGIVLDDLPASQRTRVARAMLAKPQTFWTGRAVRQAEYTYYRLIYRNFFYASGSGDTGTREMMPITQKDRWEISLSGTPRRARVQGHDAVVIDYKLATTVLTATDQPGVVEPRLRKIGGTWNEPFQLPLDPELVFQRTGYACIDEDGYPPNTADGENAAFMFDQTCAVEAPGEQSCHYTLPLPTESCADALARRVGRVDTNMHFERLAWDRARADAARVGATTGPTPDLQPLVEGLRDNRVVYRYIPQDACAVSEGCVRAPGWRRLLQFTASVKNTGGKALVAGSVADGSPYRVHNVFELSQCHGHYHFSHYGEFSYGSLPGEKKAFCLESTNRFLNTESTPWAHPYGCANQGIETGWGDDYIAGIECQWIDITGAPAGTQTLKFKSNPDLFLCEGTPVTDAQGNQLWEPTSFTTETGAPVDRPMCTFPSATLANDVAQLDVGVPEAGGYVTQPCTRDQTGPLRDCGFTAEPVRTCTPGATVKLTCAQKRDCDPVQVVRVCEASVALGGTACVYRDALANVSVEGTTTLTFTCPTARDTMETGGRYSLYTAPVVSGDAEASVTCL